MNWMMDHVKSVTTFSFRRSGNLNGMGRGSRLFRSDEMILPSTFFSAAPGKCFLLFETTKPGIVDIIVVPKKRQSLFSDLVQSLDSSATTAQKKMSDPSWLI